MDARSGRNRRSRKRASTSIAEFQVVIARSTDGRNAHGNPPKITIARWDIAGSTVPAVRKSAIAGRKSATELRDTSPRRSAMSGCSPSNFCAREEVRSSTRSRRVFTTAATGQSKGHHLAVRTALRAISICLGEHSPGLRGWSGDGQSDRSGRGSLARVRRQTWRSPPHLWQGRSTAGKEGRWATSHW